MTDSELGLEKRLRIRKDKLVNKMDKIEESAAKRLFVDMDGTLAEFKQVDAIEQLYEKDYFKNLSPQLSVVEAVRGIVKECPDIEVYILSAVLSDSAYALREKNEWLDRYLPEIDEAHRLFPPCGSDKKEFIRGGVTSSDYLLDDYTVNLNTWDPPARGIKLLNGINHTGGTWQKTMVRWDQDARMLELEIVEIMRSEQGIVHCISEGSAPLENGQASPHKATEMRSNKGKRSR